jgi:uncharacterized OsmC-like protein
MTQTATTTTARNVARNGVDTPLLFATLDAVKGQRELAKFQFRARNRWISGTHSQSTIGDFFGAGGEQRREQAFRLDGDHPQVLVGEDQGPTPVEYVLHALATCLTAGLVNIAAARGIDLDEVESTVEGDIDLQGIFGMHDKVRNGYQGIRVSFRVKGNASDEKLAGLVAQSKARSAVFDIVTNGVPVDVRVHTESV